MLAREFAQRAGRPGHSAERDRGGVRGRRRVRSRLAPSFFIPEKVVDRALSRLHELLRPGGTLVVGIGASGDDELAAAVDDLFTVRSGGSTLTPAEALARLERAGFTNTRLLERTWDAPLQLVAAVRS